MAYNTQFTVAKLCEVLGTDLPENCKEISGDVLTNLSPETKYFMDDCAFFLSSKTNLSARETLIKKAISSNVKLVVTDHNSASLEILNQIPHIFVDNVLDSIIKVADFIRHDIGMKVIGVTGSLGKTSTKEIIYSVVSQHFKTSKSIASKNTMNPLFVNLQQIPRESEVFIQEFGIGVYDSTMKNALACMPDAGVITLISDPHIDVFGSKENILKEKIKLITQAPAGVPAFLNYDDELLKNVQLEDHPIISFAVNNKEADYYAENIQYIDDHITFDVVHNQDRFNVTLNSHSKENVGNVLTAVAVAEWLGIPKETIIQGIESYKSGGIRQTLSNLGGYRLYIDCFNTAPVSLVNAVEVLDRLPVDEGGKRIAVMSDIPRLGEQSEALHFETAKKIGENSNLDVAICFGNEYAKLMADTLKDHGLETYYTDDRAELNKLMSTVISKKDITLVKGSVPRLLARSIDQVFGTALHSSAAQVNRFKTEDFQFKQIYEMEDPNALTTIITKYTGSEVNLTLPSDYNGVDAFSIAKKAFAKNVDLKHVTIPEPIYNISEAAFLDCENMQSVTLPKTLKFIDANAFRRCRALKEVVIPEGVTHIGSRAFSGCTSLTRVVLPASLGYIADDAFVFCRKAKIICPKNSYASSLTFKKK